MRRTHQLLAASLLAALLPVAAGAEPRGKTKNLEAGARPLETLPLPFASAAPDWLTSNLHVHRRSGLEYRRSLRMGENEYTLALRGPVIERKRLSFGLAVQLRF
jgi:hypothetical protein